MEMLTALFLGIIQGITEFLPISSSGHLALIQNFNKTVFGEGSFNPTLTFDVFLHFATLFSIIYIYWKDIKKLFFAFLYTVKDIFTGQFKLRPENEDKKLLYMLITTTLFLTPIIFVKNYVETTFSSLLIISSMLFVTGILTFATDKLKNCEIKAKTIKPKNACIVGIFQMFAVIPGLSRSGITIFGGALSGMKRDFAVKYSFLASIPAILGATVFQLLEIREVGMDFNLYPYFAGALAAFLAGIFSIRVVKKLAQKMQFKKFAYYCWFIAIITMIIYFRG